MYNKTLLPDGFWMRTAIYNAMALDIIQQAFDLNKNSCNETIIINIQEDHRQIRPWYFNITLSLNKQNPFI